MYRLSDSSQFWSNSVFFGVCGIYLLNMAYICLAYICLCKRYPCCHEVNSCFFINEKFSILIKTALKFVPEGPIR